MATRSKKIYNWSFSRGLIQKGFNLKTEVMMLKEELDEMQYSSPKHWYNFFNIGRTIASEYDIIDAANDLVVVATQIPYKLGYDSDKCMDETIREISSRLGSIDKSTGKFMKDLNQNPKTLYKARYNRCKLN